MKGIVFDIQKFALHDGPGIRTVVFLKGCPFQCVWCCNPESISPDPQLAFDGNLCNNCMKCAEHCPESALQPKNGLLFVAFDQCNACRLCIDECPKNALKIYGYETDADTIIAEVIKDKDYYRNSGGGITLSGGDPLFQFDFAYEILSKARQNGLNTCVESEGCGTVAQFKKILPLVDYFYFDYKITDPFDHKRYTGVEISTVLQNLALLSANNAHITLRCIVIPGINDNDEHFRAIASLSQQYLAIKQVEIMAYHDFGSGKYKQIGRPLYPIESKSVSQETADKWVNRIRELGCRNIKRG